jgi:hypothetical protein
MSTHFGAILTEIRELEHKLIAVQDLIDEVREEFTFGTHRSVGSAYRTVKQRREAPEEINHDAKAEAEEEEEFGPQSEAGSASGNWDDFAQPETPQRKGRARKPDNRLKDLYRALARRLHPDAVSSEREGARDAQEIEWWHQAQAAYESGDTQQLEMILTLIEMRDKGSKNASVSVLMQLTKQFRNALKRLRRELAECRHNPAWNFSRLHDVRPLFQRIHWSLHLERTKVASMLKDYESIVRDWEKTAQPSLKRARTRSRDLQDEEWF